MVKRSNPVGPKRGHARIIRGGASRVNGVRLCRSAVRGRINQTFLLDYVGLRVAVMKRSLKGEKPN